VFIYFICVYVFVPNIFFKKLSLVDNLPEELTCYHSLSKIGEKKSNSSLIDNSTSLYKAISSIDGMPYILRRVEGFFSFFFNLFLLELKKLINFYFYLFSFDLFVFIYLFQLFE